MDDSQKVEVEKESDGVVAAEDLKDAVRKQIHGSAGWVIVFGILEIIAGFFAISYPLLFGEALASIVGFVLIFAGVAQFMGLIRAGSGRIGVRFFIAVFYLLIGVVLVANPVSGVAFLTFIIGIFFMVEGMGKLLGAFELTNHKALLLINGLCSLILGLIILSGWPRQSDWILGLLVGINLMMSGFAAIGIGRGLKKASE